MTLVAAMPSVAVMSARRYVALLLFESTTTADRPALYREDVVLLRATSADTARELATADGRAQESTYLNAEHETVTTRLLRVVDVAETLYDNLDGDVVDLYSRHFRDVDSYRAFEPLLGGERL